MNSFSVKFGTSVDWKLANMFLTSDKAREMVKWLRTGKPDSINGDELQTLFGGVTSFDWAIKEENAAVGPYPAFPVFGTAVENTGALEPGRGA